MIQLFKPPHEHESGDTRFHIKLDRFTGTIDLLLYLIETDELNILDIELAKVTTQFLEYIHLLTRIPIDALSDFCAMTAHLLYLKSVQLLPSAEDEQIERFEMEERQQFIEQLLEYQKFKQAMILLEEKDQMYLFPMREDASWFDVEPTKCNDEWVNISIFELMTAFAKYIKQPTEEQFHVLTEYSHRLEDKMEELKRILANKKLENKATNFQDLIHKHMDIVEIVITFLALLELVKQRFIRLHQQDDFEPIVIEFM